MSFYVLIPARFDSSRLPGKPLIDLKGKPMIQRVFEQARRSDAVDVFVATDDERIRQAVEVFSGNVIMTSSEHETGTDRIHEAAHLAGLSPEDVVVNVQGDEPLMPPAAINQVAGAVSASHPMSTLKERIIEATDVFDPNIVKVVTDEADNALYFSRAPIPYAREVFSANPDELPAEGIWYRHLGIYAYTVDLLSRYVAWPQSRLERLERLEQLRVLSNGEGISVLTSTETIPPGIDVPEDVPRAIAAIEDRE